MFKRARVLLGSVLMHDERPVAYNLRKIRSLEVNYARHKLEIVVVVHALRMPPAGSTIRERIWRLSFVGFKFKIKMENQSL